MCRFLCAAYVPCAGPVLAAVAVAGSTGRIGTDTLVLALSFALGTAVPLLAFALAGRGITERIKAFRTRQRAIRVTAGAVMIALAIALVTNAPAALQRLLPDYTASLQAGTDELLQQGRGEGLGGCVPGADALADCGALPQIDGAVAWLNTPDEAPLTAQEREGKVVLIDFFAYSCINCQRNIPGIEKLHEAYADHGLQIIGVHSPEYAFEKEVDNVRGGVKDLGITYPVAVDSNLTTWTNFDNHYWPAHYLADASGTLRQLSYGEGGLATTEGLIRQLLADANPTAELPAPVFSDDAPSATGPRTPELYLGSERVSAFAGGDLEPGRQTLAFPDQLAEDTFALEGTWNVEGQYIEPQEGSGRVRLSYHGKQVNLVVSGEGDLTWSVGGEERTAHISGVPNGLELVRTGSTEAGVVEITASEGLRLYSFTFG